MYTSSAWVVLSVGAACALDLMETSYFPSSDPGALAVASVAKALKADDACPAESSASLSLMQIRSSPLRDATESQVKGIVQRSPVKVAPKQDDRLYIRLQESIPGNWGDVIDAGTGPGSLTWLAACPVNTITAVTANESSAKATLASAGDFLDRKLDKMIVGHWQDPKFMQGRQFDVVVADWLLGSVEFFAPHFQVSLLRRLHKLVKPGGWLLLTGREPDHLKNNSTVGAQLLLEIDALRDAATTLGLRHPYREVPQWWVEEELSALGYHIRGRFAEPLTLDAEYMFSQLEWAGDEIKHVRDEQLRAALEERKAALYGLLEKTKSEWQTQSFGTDYGLVATLQ